AMIPSRRFGDETRVLALEGIDTHRDPGIGKEPSVPQETKAESILSDHQLGRREQDLEPVGRRCRGLGRRAVALGVANGEESQRDRAGDDAFLYRRASV